MQIDCPQVWSDDMVAQFRDYCFPKYDRPSCQFDVFEKMFYMSIEDEQDDSAYPKRSTNVTYFCHSFGGKLLQSIPFYLVLSTEVDYYKESNIGYVQLVNGKNGLGESQAKVLAHVRQNLDLESRLDKVISDAHFPPGFGKVVTLRLYQDDCNRCSTTRVVGAKLPIHELEIEYTQGLSKDKWPMR